MANLLKETISILQKHRKSEQDIKWIGNEEQKFNWEMFRKYADFDYDDGYGGEEINTHLYIVGEDFWLERHSYDGSEWWEYKEIPAEPKIDVQEKDILSFMKNQDWFGYI